MNEIEPPSSSDSLDVRQLAGAVRFALVAIVLSFSYLSVRSSLNIPKFEQLTKDMMGGHPIPTPTAFIFEHHLLFIALSVLVPTISIAMLFSRRIVASFYVIGILGITTVAQFILLYTGLSAPVMHIISSLSGTP